MSSDPHIECTGSSTNKHIDCQHLSCGCIFYFSYQICRTFLQPVTLNNRDYREDNQEDRHQTIANKRLSQNGKNMWNIHSCNNSCHQTSQQNSCEYIELQCEAENDDYDSNQFQVFHNKLLSIMGILSLTVKSRNHFLTKFYELFSHFT